MCKRQERETSYYSESVSPKPEQRMRATSTSATRFVRQLKLQQLEEERCSDGRTDLRPADVAIGWRLTVRPRGGRRDSSPCSLDSAANATLDRLPLDAGVQRLTRLSKHRSPDQSLLASFSHPPAVTLPSQGIHHRVRLMLCLLCSVYI